MARWKFVLFSTVLVVGLFALAEVSASLYLRVFNGYDGEHLYQYVFDPYKNILPTPGYVDTRGVRHNSQGFRRSTEVSPDKPDGTVRIFLMGGSTAYGLGGLWTHIENDYPVLKNSETIDAYLERDLNQEYGGGVHFEVINAAITSAWTHHELIYLNQTILGFQPDIVLMLDGFNDFFYHRRNHDQFASYAYSMPSQVILGDPTLYSLAYGTGWWLFRKSAFFHVLGRSLRVAKLIVEGKPEQPPIDPERRMAGLRRVFPENALSMHRRMGLILADAGVDAVFMLQPMLLLERNRVGMPPIERELFDFTVNSYRPNYEDYVLQAADYFREEEARMAADVGGTFIDLTTVFQGFEGQMYTDYAHLTPQGNEIVATHIRDRLRPLIARRLLAESPETDHQP